MSEPRRTTVFTQEEKDQEVRRIVAERTEHAVKRHPFGDRASEVDDAIREWGAAWADLAAAKRAAAGQARQREEREAAVRAEIEKERAEGGA